MSGVATGHLRTLRRFLVGSSIGITTLALAGLSVRDASAETPERFGPEGPRAMVLLARPSLEASLAVRSVIVAEGGRVTFELRPAMLVAFLPDEAAARIAALPEVLDLRYGQVESAAYGPLTREQEAGLAIWNDYYMGLRIIEGDGIPPGAEGPSRDYACGIAVPREFREEAGGGSAGKKGYGAGAYSTSEYMLLDGAGSLHKEFHVKFVFPESNGAIDTNQENWTNTDMSNFLVECVEGIEWWSARYAPARLSVVVSTTWQVNIPWEPINHAHTFDATWVDDLMDSLGYGGASYFNKVRNFDNNYLVSADEAWFNTIFVVNSQVDANGRFTDNWFDYSYFGGPFLVMTWDNGPWGNDDTDYLCAHETGHTFYALDEYATSGCHDSSAVFSRCDSTLWTSGYLNVPNGNCENDGGTSVECIMRNNFRTEYTNGSVCDYTRRAIGWQDTDNDSIPDIIDHPPIVTLNGFAATTTCDSTPTYSGTVVPERETNRNPLSCSDSSSVNENISINSVDLVEFRLNGGGWLPATPTDGAWDEADEGFAFTTASLTPQAINEIEVRALNSRGLYSTAVRDSLILVPGDVWSDTFDDGDASDWSISNGGATISLDNTVAHSGTWSVKCVGNSGTNQGATATSQAFGASPAPYIDTGEPYTISFWFRYSDFHWARWVLFGHVRLIIDYPTNTMKYDPNGNWTGLLALGNNFNTYAPANTWKEVAISVNPTARTYTVSIGGTLLGTATYNASVVPATTLSFVDHYSVNDFLSAWYDDFQVSGCAAPTAVSGPESVAHVPAARLLGAVPNPFNPSTMIRFELPRATPVTLRVYDVAGALVRTLVAGRRGPGVDTVPWDGRDGRGREVPSGIYFLELVAERGRDVAKVTLLR